MDAQRPSRVLGRKGRAVAWCLEAPVLMVGTDPLEVDRLLTGGELRCPGCAGELRPWGYAGGCGIRDEQVRRRPRRSCCSGCSVTHVLLPASCLSRRADDVEVIGSALLAKATGLGHRPIAVLVGRPVSTVRGWLRRFGCCAEGVRVLFTGLLHALDGGGGGGPDRLGVRRCTRRPGAGGGRGGSVVRAPTGMAVRRLGKRWSAARSPPGGQHELTLGNPPRRRQPSAC